MTNLKTKALLYLLICCMICVKTKAQTIVINSPENVAEIERNAYLKSIGCYCEYIHNNIESYFPISLIIKEYQRLKNNNCNKGGVYKNGDMIAVMEQLGKRIIGYKKEKIIEILGEPDEIEKNKFSYSFGIRSYYLKLNFKNNKCIGSKSVFYSE